MASLQRRWFRALTRVAAVMLIGAAVSACSTVPSWVDPTTWMGPDVPDQAQTVDNGTYPDLSKIPSAPQQTASHDSAAVASSLVQARNDVQYSAQALRGGTEAAAAAPAPAPTKAQIAQAEKEASQPAPEKKAPEEKEAAAAPEPQVASAPEPAPTPAASSPEPAVPAVPKMTTAESSVPGAMPAVPVAGPDGFQPSKAPPLDASVAQFVPGSIIARYAQTGAVAPVATVGGDVKLKAPSGARQAILGTGRTDVGGPESMSGAVVAHLGSLQSSQGQPSAYVNAGGLQPMAVVHFSGVSTAMNAAGRHAVQQAADAYKTRGGQGYIRVVGHASIHGKMSLVRRMEANFRRSQSRARAVARALIRAGVPANKVLIDAVGGSQPAAQGGNQRAEIFLQG